MPLPIYQSLVSEYTDKASALDKRLRLLSTIRLLLFAGFLFAGYKSFQTAESFVIISSIACLVTFLIILRIYDRIEQDLFFYKGLVQVNKAEIDFLNSGKSTTDAGEEYINPDHSYSYDLDIFGKAGLYPFLNRTGTPAGKKKLAQLLLNPDTDTILQRQEAAEELKGKLKFRQSIYAHSKRQASKENEMQQLKAWIDLPTAFKNKSLYYFLCLFPLLAFGLLAFYIYSDRNDILNLFYLAFIINIAIPGIFGKRIKQHLTASAAISKVLEQYSSQIKTIEDAQFQSSLLISLQQKFITDTKSASKSIRKLASLLGYIETFLNLVLMPLLNGFFLFHLHILFALEKWKEENGKKIIEWLDHLGEIEALNSLANLAYNNEDFCTPVIDTQATLTTEAMGHPLIRKEKRVPNTISFAEKKFVILTGSNMSGKSTFLRTIGINLVLAKAGSVVCAKSFTFYPYEIYVSMRITDSLQDSESFFYAELKRLQNIIIQLQTGEEAFVILDEILRGTNSNDKHSGTIGLIRKLATVQTTGIIATHDLTVSKLAEEYPNYISNNCFESQIIDGELVFDFTLRNGICTTLSASYLMQKMGIIDKKQTM